MSIPYKILNHSEISSLELLLSGAFAPVQGYLNRDDHCAVLSHGRLANGYLWPLPLALSLSAAEKRAAQLSGRVILLDAERRELAEVSVESCYRLPSELLSQAQQFDTQRDANTWYVSGAVRSLQKVLHPLFNRLRHGVHELRHDLKAWPSVIAVLATPALKQEELQTACEWLRASETEGGLLVQIAMDETQHNFREHVRSLRQQVRCQAAQQVKLSLLPCVEGLDESACLLLQALVSRNFGATGLVLSADLPKAVRRHLLQHRDEIGLEFIPVRHAVNAFLSSPAVQHPLCVAA